MAKKISKQKKTNQKTKKVVQPKSQAKSESISLSKEKEKPQYFSQATINCVCGAKFEVGSTIKEINVEICSSCHPFFTGSQKFIDTAGQVDKYKARFKKFEAHKSQKKSARSSQAKSKPAKNK